MKQTLKEFFPDQLALPEERECILSQRLPVFTIRAVNEEQAARIRATAMRTQKQKGNTYQEIDAEANLLALVVACVQQPDLHSAELQGAWGVMGAESVLKKMLLPGEYAALSQQVCEICGFDEDASELVEQAKN